MDLCQIRMEDLVPGVDEFEGQDHQGQKWNFSTLSVAYVQFVFDKTSLASSCCFYYSFLTISHQRLLLSL